MSQHAILTLWTLVVCLAFQLGCTRKLSLSSGGDGARSADGADVIGENNSEGEDGEEGAERERPLRLTQMAISDTKNKLRGLLEGEEQLAALCARHAGKPNRVIQAFCVENLRPTNIKELHAALGLAVQNVGANRNINANGGNPGFAYQGHSSSLVGRFTNAINPRVILFSPQNLGNNNSNPRFVVLGFVRGEQFVEVIANNGPDQDGNQQLDVFLVGFKQACNSRPEGCNAGELLTDYIESNWTSITVYDDEDLKNSIVDCRHCHQPQGPGTQNILRMQELTNPWTHWFRDNRDSNVLTNDFLAAHGQNGEYAGLPNIMARASDPQLLENLVRGNGFRDLQVREMEFNGGQIENQVRASAPGQPADNTIPGQSATWERLFQEASRGFTDDGRMVIPIPYHDIKVTEPELLEIYTRQYQDFRAGMVSLEEFQDHREVLRTDQIQRANMGFAVRPGTPPETMMMQSCAQCHNANLDQDISRARFDVDLDSMGPAAIARIEIAIERLKLGYTPERREAEGIFFYNEDGEKVDLAKGEHLLTMPPRRFKDLTDEQIDEFIEYLRGEQVRLRAANPQ